jgi:hypothetical protein
VEIEYNIEKVCYVNSLDMTVFDGVHNCPSTPINVKSSTLTFSL